MTSVGRGTMALAVLSAVGCSPLVATPARADDPVMHEVKYVITAASPIWADIYYLDQQPAKFSDYSHNTYQYTPNVQADIAPGHPWVSPVGDADGSRPVRHGHRQHRHRTGHADVPLRACRRRVVVKASNDGPKGALCSLRQSGEAARFRGRPPDGAGSSRRSRPFRCGRRTCRAPARSPGLGTRWSSAPTTPAAGSSPGSTP